MKILFVIAALLILAGCATPLGQNVQRLTRADAQAALDIATAHGDQRGMQCHAAFLATVTDAPAPADIKVAGPLSGYELARVTRLDVEAGLPDAVQSACAPMFLDSQRALLRVLPGLIQLP